MTFPKAALGVKKLFTAEILHLIGTVCLILAGVFAVVALGSMESESGAGFIAGGIGSVVFIVAAGVLPIIGFIIQLVGLKQASNDEASFNQAFLMAIFALILTVLASIFASLNVGNGVVDNIVRIFVEVTNILIVIFVINGVQNLSVRLGKENMVEGGNKILILIAVVYGLALIANLIIAIFGSGEGGQVTAGILAIVAGVLDFIAYIIFLVYLGKAKKMLLNN